MKEISTCPLCGNRDFIHHLKTKDHFLSNESFTISKCSNCGFLLTNPIPAEEVLGAYYQSEEYLSHSKLKKGAFSKIYNLVRNYSISKKHQLISTYVTMGSILDIGCGTGEVLKYFSDKGWQTQGIEPSENARKYAVENLGLSVEREEYLFAIENKSIDVVTMWHVLEHVPHLNERMQQLKSILKDDGILIIALPNYNSWDAQIFSTEWAAWEVPRHLYHFSKDTFSLLAKKHNFKITEILPMKFDAFFVSLLSEKYRSGKMNYVKAFFQGIKSNRWAKKNAGNYSSLIYVLRKDLS